MERHGIRYLIVAVATLTQALPASMRGRTGGRNVTVDVARREGALRQVARKRDGSKVALAVDYSRDERTDQAGLAIRGEVRTWPELVAELSREGGWSVPDRPRGTNGNLYFLAPDSLWDDPVPDALLARWGWMSDAEEPEQVHPTYAEASARRRIWGIARPDGTEHLILVADCTEAERIALESAVGGQAMSAGEAAAYKISSNWNGEG